VAQVGYLYGLAHLGLVVVIQDLVHLVSEVGHLDSAEADLLESELFYLKFNLPALGVTLRIVIAVATMILIAVSRGVGKEYRQFALGLPFLLEGIFKTASHILRHIATAHRIKLFQKL